jgi:hypothetical protein
MGKFGMALTYVLTITVGVVFAYFTLLSGGSLLIVFGVVLVVVYSAYLLWADFIRRDRLKS